MSIISKLSVRAYTLYNEKEIHGYSIFHGYICHIYNESVCVCIHCVLVYFICRYLIDRS